MLQCLGLIETERDCITPSTVDLSDKLLGSIAQTKRHRGTEVSEIEYVASQRQSTDK